MNDKLKNLKLRICSLGYFRYGKRGLFHRLVWEIEKGPIPEGFHIHHKDGNKLNNSIENLECLPHSQHLSKHMKANVDKLYIWHRSPEGRQQLGEKSRQLWKLRTVHELSCERCGKPFKAIQIDRARFCSDRCQEINWRKKGKHLTERECEICKKLFVTNKYQKTRTCGYKCGGILAHKKFY